jgi:molybdopterin converting factor small subunit
VAVDIEVFGQLLPNQPRRRAVEIQTPATVRELARLIGLREEEIGLVMIDGVQSGLDHCVQPDSRLCFFPYVSGG